MTLLDEMQRLADQAFPPGEDFTHKVDGGTITVQDLDDLTKRIFETRILIEEADKIVSGMNKKLEVLKQQAVQYLQALNRKDYSSPFGNIRIDRKYRVNLPPTDEDKAKLFEWLRERGLFDRYATVNSQSLNSLYMAEWDAAKRSGEGMTFEIPGVPEPKVYETLGVTKARKQKEE